MLQVNLGKFASDLPPQYLDAVINSPAAVWDTVPEVCVPIFILDIADIQMYRENCLRAYTETLRAVYIIGVPCAILAFCGALFIKNSKMQTKAEEEEAIRKAREEAAAEDGTVTAGDAEKRGERLHDSATVEREEEEAVALSSVAPVPQAAVEAGKGDNRVL